MSHPFDDPFSRVHPFFWPVLWLSLRAFVRWSAAMIEQGHGFAGIGIEITWYGTIHVTRLDLSPEGEAFRRHMAGAVPRARWSHGLPAQPRLVWSSDGETFAPPSPTCEACAKVGRALARHFTPVEAPTAGRGPPYLNSS